QVSGIVVLDIDPRNGGDDTLDELEAEHGKLPQTVEVITGGGGRHLYFQHPGGKLVGKLVAKLGNGIDVQADGKYVVAPPSIHESGERYVFEASSGPDDVEVAALPEWLEELLTSPSRQLPLAAEDVSAIVAGHRDNVLTSLAGAMRRRGMSEAAILQALVTEN